MKKKLLILTAIAESALVVVAVKVGVEYALMNKVLPAIAMIIVATLGLLSAYAFLRDLREE